MPDFSAKSTSVPRQADSRSVLRVSLPLSAFCVPGTEQDSPPSLPHAWDGKATEMAGQFFSEDGSPLLQPSGDARADRLTGMERLLQFLAALYLSDFPYDPYFRFMGQLYYGPGRLQIMIRLTEMPSYDGGSGGTTDYYDWLEIRRVPQSPDEIRSAPGISWKETKPLNKTRLYRGALPGGDCECLAEYISPGFANFPRLDFEKGIFLMNPFGLRGAFLLRIHDTLSPFPDDRSMKK